MISVLFVCLGNICRSPALQGTLQSLIDKKGYTNRVFIDSCALGDWYLGQSVDARMQQAAAEREISLSHTARLIGPEDFEIYDFIFAATREILEELKFMAPSEKAKKKIYLATYFSSAYKEQDIPDPYYGSRPSFDRVMDMVIDCCQGILNFLEPFILNK